MVVPSSRRVTAMVEDGFRWHGQCRRQVGGDVTGAQRTRRKEIIQKGYCLWGSPLRRRCEQTRVRGGIVRSRNRETELVQVRETLRTHKLNSELFLCSFTGSRSGTRTSIGNMSVRQLSDNKQELGVMKILIIDWDIHHGNGTQKVLWNDSRVLFFSIHSHELGRLYPESDDGNYTMIGERAGAGYNINVPWDFLLDAVIG